ncbi:hypothetical protein [Enterocloster citroniae]
MYSWEITNFINERNGILTVEESNLINNTKDNPQLDHIIFHPSNNSYELWDREGTHFSFLLTGLLS